MTLELMFLLDINGIDCSVFCIGDKELKPKAKAKYIISSSLSFAMVSN